MAASAVFLGVTGVAAYNRPIARALHEHETWPILAFATAYTIFAGGFGLVVFGGGEA